MRGISVFFLNCAILLAIAASLRYNNPESTGKDFPMKDINIVLHEPEIPQNTGNIARTCAATGAALHIIKPMGFTVTDRHLKRAGLDYWHLLDITYYESLDDFFEKNPDCRFYCFSTKAPCCYTDITYEIPVFLFFGKETKGLPEDFLSAHLDRCVRIPMRESLRSLNLSNSVAIGVYEILRQTGFRGQQNESDYLTSRAQIAPIVPGTADGSDYSADLPESPH